MCLVHTFSSKVLPRTLLILLHLVTDIIFLKDHVTLKTEVMDSLISQE